METVLHPDISHLSQADLSYVQSILPRSKLRNLLVACTLFDPNLADSVYDVLLSVQWSTLQSVILSGSAVNKCINFWQPPAVRAVRTPLTLERIGCPPARVFESIEGLRCGERVPAGPKGFGSASRKPSSLIELIDVRSENLSSFMKHEFVFVVIKYKKKKINPTRIKHSAPKNSYV